VGGATILGEDGVMSRFARALATAALVAAPVIALAPAAVATTVAVDPQLAAAADSLRGGDPVYVSPDADPTLTSAEADSLRARIEAIGYPMYIAVLPVSAAVDDSPDATLRALRDEVGLQGTYALYIGNAFRAGDTNTRVGDLAGAAYTQNRDDGPYAVLDAFVASAGERLAGTTGEPPNTAGTLAFLGGAAVLVGGGGYWLYRRSKKATAERTAAVRRTVDEDVTAYGELVARVDVDDPRLDDEGRADAQRALDAYEKAKSASAAMVRPEQAATVTEALEDGRFALACVEARREGRALPERRPPCFVDPRHGPSVEDVSWAPDGGAERPVPVCTACAATLHAGGLPAPREVEVAGSKVPYWRGGRQYAPYAGGYYAHSGADMMSVLFMGTMIGSMMSGPTVINTGADGGAAGGGWGGGGGDFGSGGFGGGDFGGGDFGGGGDF
jgi:hypothetical protein